MSDLLIGIDIGTGSSKGVLSDTEGNVLEIATRKHQTSFPRPGWAEHDADGVWWTDILSILRELTGLGKGKVKGVALSGIGPCVLPADEQGRPLRPGILYGVDTRATDEIAELTAYYGEQTILETCGNELTSQSAGPKMLWVRRNEPDVWASTRRWFMAHTYGIFHLTGAYVLDRLSASYCDPLYSPFTQDWILDRFEHIAPGVEPPKLMWSNEVAGLVTEDAARITGLEPGTPVAVGSLDAFTEALSIGVRKPGDVMLMYGSTMVAAAVADVPMIAPALWSTSGLFNGTFYVAGGMSTTGSLTTWAAEVVSADIATLVAEAGDALPGANGLLCLPYFSGERAPIADPDARGVLCGLTLTHGRKEIYRAMLESTGFGSRHLLDTMRSVGAQAENYVAVGGGTQGGLWPQIMSDIIGITQTMPKVTVGAAYGDCLLAAMAIGAAEEDTVWNSADRQVTPNLDNREVYDAMYQVYRELYPAAAPAMHALAKLQR